MVACMDQDGVGAARGEAQLGDSAPLKGRQEPIHSGAVKKASVVVWGGSEICR